MNGRLASLDALRGFDMFFIMGLGGLVTSLCVALGWGSDCWLAAQMQHPSWLGLTQRDTIFPLFLFIAGISFPFSLAKQRENGASAAHVLLRIGRRLAMLVLLGMVYERFFSSDARAFRYGSVLARIGIAWAVAATLHVFLGLRARIAVAAAIVAGYWAVNVFMGAPDNPSAGHFTPEGNIAVYVDRTFLAAWSRLSPGTKALPFDNQGLLSTFPAVVTAMLGMFTGEFVKGTRGRVSGDRQSLCMAVAAALLAVVGCFIAWGLGPWSFPFSKVLWSPSFLLVVAGYSLGLFALFYWLIDVRGIWRRTLFFRVIGMNSIAIYLAQPVLNFHRANDMLFGRLAGLFPAIWSPVVLGAFYVAFCWCFVYVLYRQKLFLKV